MLIMRADDLVRKEGLGRRVGSAAMLRGDGGRSPPVKVAGGIFGEGDSDITANDGLQELPG